MAKSKQKVVVKQDPENEVPAEILAKAIVDVDAGFKRMHASPLTERAIVLLVHHASGVSVTDVRRVLLAAAALKETYIKKAKA